MKENKDESQLLKYLCQKIQRNVMTGKKMSIPVIIKSFTRQEGVLFHSFIKMNISCLLMFLGKPYMNKCSNNPKLIKTNRAF